MGFDYKHNAITYFEHNWDRLFRQPAPKIMFNMISKSTFLEKYEYQRDWEQSLLTMDVLPIWYNINSLSEEKLFDIMINYLDEVAMSNVYSPIYIVDDMPLKIIERGNIKETYMVCFNTIYNNLLICPDLTPFKQWAEQNNITYNIVGWSFVEFTNDTDATLCQLNFS